MDNLKAYLLFEGEMTQQELEDWEESQSEADRFRVLNKRREAAKAWLAEGRELPEGISFST